MFPWNRAAGLANAALCQMTSCCGSDFHFAWKQQYFSFVLFFLPVDQQEKTRVKIQDLCVFYWKHAGWETNSSVGGALVCFIRSFINMLEQQVSIFRFPAPSSWCLFSNQAKATLDASGYVWQHIWFKSKAEILASPQFLHTRNYTN